MGNKTGEEKLLEIHSFEDMMDYDNPSALGSLIKSCIVFSKMVDLEAGKHGSLSDYLIKVRKSYSLSIVLTPSVSLSTDILFWLRNQILVQFARRLWSRNL